MLWNSCGGYTDSVRVGANANSTKTCMNINWNDIAENYSSPPEPPSRGQIVSAVLFEFEFKTYFANGAGCTWTLFWCRSGETWRVVLQWISRIFSHRNIVSPHPGSIANTFKQIARSDSIILSAHIQLLPPPQHSVPNPGLTPTTFKKIARSVSIILWTHAQLPPAAETCCPHTLGRQRLH